MEQIAQHFQSYREAPDPRHLDVLDGVRALCVLLVGWFHIWQQSWLSPYFTVFGLTVDLDFLLRSGYLWVDGMILLSGFLLYLPYARAGSRLPAVWPFYKRRLIRIVPSYLLCVIPLFVLACVKGQYPSARDAAWDLITHLTFTFNLFPATYFSSPINGALWTIAVEMQFYLIFPLLARAFKKAPLITWLAMADAAFLFRIFGSAQADTGMFFNQMPAFLDVYANGFLAAWTFTALKRYLEKKRWGKGKMLLWKLLATAVMIACVCLLVRIARDQAMAPDIQRGQMERRFPLSAALGCFMVCAAFSVPAVRFLLGNALMRFLAGISMQFYIWHQWLAVRIKEWRLEPSQSAAPWSAYESGWQIRYTLLCFLLAFLLAVFITYVFERPIARALRGRLRAENEENTGVLPEKSEE